MVWPAAPYTPHQIVWVPNAVYRLIHSLVSLGETPFLRLLLLSPSLCQCLPGQLMHLPQRLSQVIVVVQPSLAPHLLVWMRAHKAQGPLGSRAPIRTWPAGVHRLYCWIAIRHAYRTRGRCGSQSRCRQLDKMTSWVARVRLNCSTSPSLWGCNGVVQVFLMPSCRQTLLNTPASMFPPLVIVELLRQFHLAD